MGQKIIKSGRKLAITYIAAAAAMLGSTSGAHAETEPGDAVAAVVTPLTIIKRADLDMGRMIAGTAGGTVTLDVSGARTATGTVTLIGTDFGLARFAGQGTTNQRVQIQLPNNINLTGPGPQMRMDNFEFGPDATLPGTYIRLGNSPNIRLQDPSGAFGFVVGADLDVGANQPGGVYSATFDVTANYQ